MVTTGVSGPATRTDGGPGAGAVPGVREGGMVTCGYCGSRFVEDAGQPTCEACPLSKACSFVRCPTCGYENPKEPKWMATIRKWVSR